MQGPWAGGGSAGGVVARWPLRAGPEEPAGAAGAVPSEQTSGGEDVEANATIKAKAAAAKAAFAAEMQVEGEENSVPMVPLSRLNMTLRELNLTRAEAAESRAMREAAAARMEELEASLEAANERVGKLLTGLKDIGGLVGAGGFGNLLSFIMSDDDLIETTKAKINELKRQRR